MVVKIARLDRSAEDLRRQACCVSDCAQSRRLLALASILDGASRTQAAKNAGMERQTLADWVHRYNAEGVEGLKDRARTGRRARLGSAELTEFDEIAATQPDPVRDGVVRWRRRDLKEVIAKRFGIVISERSVGRILREQGFRKLSVRPQHPEADPSAQEAFKQTSPGIL